MVLKPLKMSHSHSQPPNEVTLINDEFLQNRYNVCTYKQKQKMSKYKLNSNALVVVLQQKSNEFGF